MNNRASPYYPPRARWYSPLLLTTRGAMRLLALDRIRLPSGVPLSTAVWSLLVPGLGIYLRGYRYWGRLAMGTCALLVLIFIAGLGTVAGNLAFGLLLSIHVTSVLYAFEPWLVGERFRTRLLFSACSLLALAGLVYMPAREFVQQHWLMPLRVKGRVVVVYRLGSSQGLSRGTRIAYAYEGTRCDELVVRHGIGIGPVLALPGDRVKFGATTFEVNGVAQPSLPHMPRVGQWTVPEKHWFVWPEIGIRGHGAASREAVAAALLHVGTITETQMIGRPFKRWLWRRQF